MNSSLVIRLALLASVGLSLGGCTVQIPAGLLPIDGIKPGKPPAVEQPIARLPYQRPPVVKKPPVCELPVEPQPVPDLAQELVLDFEQVDGKDLALWDTDLALLTHREPGLNGSAGALEVVLAPGASKALIELREALPATDLATRILSYDVLNRYDGQASPALEVQFSEDGGETWSTALYPTDAIPPVLASEVVSESADSAGNAVESGIARCMPYQEARHAEVVLPTGKIRVRFVISQERYQGGSLVLDDLQIIARGQAGDPEPGVVTVTPETGCVGYPEPADRMLPAATK